MTRARRRPFDPAAKIHDRRASEVGRQSQVAPIVVDDPMGLDPGDKIAVMRNLRDDPLARLHSRKSIDEAQYQAGRAFQADWEAASRGPQAIDPGKEAVDGGRPPEAITEPQRRAVARLAQIDRGLGPDGAALTRDVLIERLAYVEIARRRDLPGKRWEEYFGFRFRLCLDLMAAVYGFSNERPPRNHVNNHHLA
jgi:hypothetical protein